MFDEDVILDDESVEEDTSSTYLIFDLGSQALGVSVGYVREIIDSKKITPLPNAPGDILGVVDVRGRSVPVVDLRGRLGILRDAFEENGRMVVLEVATDAGHRLVAIQADRMRNVEQVAAGEIEPLPNSGFGHWNAGVLLGLLRRGGDLVVLVDLSSVLGADGGKNIDLSAGMGIF